MSLSKAPGKQAISKTSKAVHIAGAGVVSKTPYKAKTENSTIEIKSLAQTNLIVLTVNPKLDKVASAEKLNAKAESAKQMFANYRNKK